MARRRSRGGEAAIWPGFVDGLSSLILVFVEGKTHVEAAQELSLPLGTVKSRVRLALKKLEILVGNKANGIQP